MRAIYVDAPYKSSVHEVPMPDLNDNEVLIKVAYAGICGSDLHVYRGKHAFRTPPVMIGHEISGTVAGFGNDVTGFSIGEPITVLPMISCGKCDDCKNGKTHICEDKILPSLPGWRGLGAFADYFVAPANLICKLDGVDIKLAALSEPLAVATHFMSRFPKDHNKDLVIIGAGTIGLLILSIAYAYGFERIMVTDLDDYNLSIAKKLGATCTVNAGNEDVITRVKEEFGEHGVKNIAVAAGGPSIINQVFDIAGSGANIIFTAMITEPTTCISYPIVFKELNFCGSFNYVLEDFETAINFLRTDGDRISNIITHEKNMEEIDDAFQIFDKKPEPCIKILLKINSEI